MVFPGNRVSAVLVEMGEQFPDSSSKNFKLTAFMFGYFGLLAHKSHILMHGFEPWQGGWHVLRIGEGFKSSIAYSAFTDARWFTAAPTLKQ